jgi:flagellar biosynthesis protein FlhB
MKLLSLDLQFFAGEKTERATPKKRQDAKKKGQVAKSQDLTTAISLLGTFLYFFFGSSYMGQHLFQLFQISFNSGMIIPVTPGSVQLLFIKYLKEVAYILAPILIVAVAAGLVGNFAQVGITLSGESLKPNIDKINPLKGFKRIYSIRAIVELLKSILKISFIGTITFLVLWKKIDEVLGLSFKSVGDSFRVIGNITLQMGLAASLALLFLALFDYFYQRFDFEKNIRMSKQDIKDEYKNSEGDPLIKSKIKQRQREMAMRRMMEEVPKADVIITNPTHYAICLKYDESKRDAPYVLAKGIDYIAQKIKEKGKEKDIIMVENRPLARALYDQTEIGDVIPEEFFKAVAEILAYVYRLKNKI